MAQLGERHQLQGAVIEVHAGNPYCEPLIGSLAAAGATLIQPLEGLRLGERLAWYGAQSPTNEPGSAPDVTWLLDERNAVTPEEFLTAGRTAADRPGLYTWWVDADGAHALSAGLGHRIAPGLVYAGRAGGVRPNGGSSTNTLWGRLATMHLGGNREFSTFRLTLAACLSQPHELPTPEADLTAWMDAHLRVATLPLRAAAVVAAEEALLRHTDPPLNLEGMDRTPLRQMLTRLRKATSGR